ncbi:hypothetical protein TNCV_4431991 [Trichonephila clavipes]|nr:hypothetical protein TNCV_4431991 [Trichonephila clavipes]
MNDTLIGESLKDFRFRGGQKQCLFGDSEERYHLPIDRSELTPAIHLQRSVGQSPIPRAALSKDKKACLRDVGVRAMISSSAEANNCFDLLKIFPLALILESLTTFPNARLKSTIDLPGLKVVTLA